MLMDKPSEPWRYTLCPYVSLAKPSSVTERLFDNAFVYIQKCHAWGCLAEVTVPWANRRLRRLTPTPANKLDRYISLSKNMVYSEIKQSDWWIQRFHDSPFSSEMAPGFPIHPRHSPRPQCLSSTLAERLDEPLANMARLMYDIGSRGSWDETCGVVEVAWCRDIKRAAKSCQVPYKPGDQSRGLDGPLGTGFPSSQSAYIALTRSEGRIWIIVRAQRVRRLEECRAFGSGW